MGLGCIWLGVHHPPSVTLDSHPPGLGKGHCGIQEVAGACHPSHPCSWLCAPGRNLSARSATIPQW